MGQGDRDAPLFTLPATAGADTVLAAATINAQNALPAGAGTANSYISTTVQGRSTLIAQLNSNTLSQGLLLQASVDGVNWFTVGGVPWIEQATGLLKASIPANTTGIYSASVSDFEYARISTPNVALTGAASVVVAASGALAGLAIDSPVSVSPVNAGATPVGATSGNVAAAAAVATLPAVAGVTNYLSGIEISGSGATAASVVLATVTGLKGGTKSYAIAVPANVTGEISRLIEAFNPPLPASAVNTAIVVTLPSLGAGNTNAVANAHGFTL